jgi:ubiquinone/menaquinone biosynthesis C-methylase UbiE
MGMMGKPATPAQSTASSDDPSSERLSNGPAGEIGSISDNVARFYDTYGWVDQGGGESGEDLHFRRFPQAYAGYAAQSAKRTLALFSNRGGFLLIVGCGDMPDSHVQIVAGFEQVTCMDISTVALAIAERRLGPAASYRRESIVDTTLPDNQFDAAFCAHAIYHIDKDEQAKAVDQLMRVIKPGGRAVIVYANPHSPAAMPGEILRWAKRPIRTWRSPRGARSLLYYHAHSLRWWRRFATKYRVTILPCEVIGSRPARALLRSDRLAAAFFKFAAWFEAKMPRVSVLLWHYPIIVIDKTNP